MGIIVQDNEDIFSIFMDFFWAPPLAVVTDHTSILLSVLKMLVLFCSNEAYNNMMSAYQTQATVLALLVTMLCISPVIILLVHHATQTIQHFAGSLATRTDQLSCEKRKSDQLLSQMLPPSVVKQLKLQKQV